MPLPLQLSVSKRDRFPREKVTAKASGGGEEKVNKHAWLVDCGSPGSLPRHLLAVCAKTRDHNLPYQPPAVVGFCRAGEQGAVSAACLLSRFPKDLSHARLQRFRRRERRFTTLSTSPKLHRESNSDNTSVQALT